MASRAEHHRADNLTWHPSEVTLTDRRRANGHAGATLWLTGLSGSGKSTIAFRVEKMLLDRKIHAFVLDGDNIRHGLNRDLGFSEAEREENIRRIGEVARLFTEAGVITIVSFVSPTRASRRGVRERYDTLPFFELWVSTPLSVCEDRDPKDLYRRARSGEIAQFTGISAPYEAPEHPDLELPAHEEPVEDCARRVVALLEARDLIPSGGAHAHA